MTDSVPTIVRTVEIGQQASQPMHSYATREELP